ncbi:MAG: DNA adenine methylase [Planctomycetes bacterium]|nr:DNA adenine methylase [Planctomycetota bacterium]
MRSLLRYPGSKAKLAREIITRFPMKPELWSNPSQWEYREPFFGAGAVGLNVLKGLDRRCRVWLNDIDPGIAALWEAVLSNPSELIQRIAMFEPSAQLFSRFKETDGCPCGDVVERGFRKLALHRMSFSGLGAMSGGPLREVSSRWNPEQIKCEVSLVHERLARFDSLRITCLDFAKVLRDAGPRCFMYCDPPYIAKGAQLYKHSMSEGDHARLARLLKDCKAHWVLSYDDHPLVRSLYPDARIEPVSLAYTVAASKGTRRTSEETIVVPKTADELREIAA